MLALFLPSHLGLSASARVLEGLCFRWVKGYETSKLLLEANKKIQDILAINNQRSTPRDASSNLPLLGFAAVLLFAALTLVFAILPRKRSLQNRLPLFFVLPFLIIYGVFVLLPGLLTFSWSFWCWDGINKPSWVGFANYAVLLQSKSLLLSTIVSLVYCSLKVTAVTTLSFGIASLIQLRLRSWRTILTNILVCPALLGLVIVGKVWQQMLSPTRGFPGTYLPELFDTPWLALFAVALATTWWENGLFVLIFLASMGKLPAEYREDARTCGATDFQFFRHVLIPSQKRTIFFVMLTVFVSAMSAFGEIYVLTRGGPDHTTETLYYFAYALAFESFRFGQSATVVFAMFVLGYVLALPLVKQFRPGTGDLGNLT